MKALRALVLFSPLALFMVALSSCANTGTSGSTSITDAPVVGANNLQVVMTIPPSWYPMLEDRIDDAFVSHMADVFRQEGFQGNLVDVRPPDQPNPAYPVLSINLVDWRMDHTGSVQCDFGAALQTQTGRVHLGTFNGMAIRWMAGPGRFGLADTYGNAVDDALRQLYRSIAQTQMMPGTIRR
jgi:hypothetical protein